MFHAICCLITGLLLAAILGVVWLILVLGPEMTQHHVITGSPGIMPREVQRQRVGKANQAKGKRS